MDVGRIFNWSVVLYVDLDVEIVSTWSIAEVSIDVWVVTLSVTEVETEVSMVVDFVENNNVGDWLGLVVDVEIKVDDGSKVDSIDGINVGTSELNGIELVGGSKVDMDDGINVGTSELNGLELVDGSNVDSEDGINVGTSEENERSWRG